MVTTPDFHAGGPGSIPVQGPNNFLTQRNLCWYDGCGLNLYHLEWAELLVKIVMYYMLLLYIACVVLLVLPVVKHT